MKNKFKPLIIISVIIFIAIVILSSKDKFSCQRINCLSLKDINQYKIKDIYEESDNIFRALYAKESSLLRVEVRPNSTKNDADQAIQIEITLTKGIFEDAAAPYPGQISDVISCSKEYKPIYSTASRNGTDISSFEGYVNGRLVFGSCVSDQAAFHDTMLMFYCKNQSKFYKIEVIIPRKDYLKNMQGNNDIVDSVGCKS